MYWHALISAKRFGMEEYHEMREENRSEFLRDYDRLIFSAPFRRLQNKTQVFPLPGSVFVHNRLTHSLEVSSVGRSLGNDSAKLLLEKHPELKDSFIPEIGSVVAAACLAHDLGNPPFGHSGEKAISTYFSEGNGQKLKDNKKERISESLWQDLIHFEGNANAFRLLTHQFNGRRQGGFAMTYATLASVVKYPFASGLANGKPKFGFFNTEEDSFRSIADDLGLRKISDAPLHYSRHPLVFLVEAADDICYQIMDIEDAHKLKILTGEETKNLFLNFLAEEQNERTKRTFDIVTDINEQIAYLRSSVIGLLIKECTHVFVANEEAILSGEFTDPLICHVCGRAWDAYRQCVEISNKRIYRYRDVLDIELAGFHVITTLLDLMIGAVREPDKAYSKLLIDRVSEQYDIRASDINKRVQAVLDYISGMTDVFALDMYRKINGNSLPAV